MHLLQVPSKCYNTLTILHVYCQVLLYDPLYVWTLSPLKARSLQRKADLDTSEIVTCNTDVLDASDRGLTNENLNGTPVNKIAERVLVRLRQKLDGIEDNTLLSVKGQVNHLIREARDSKNLSRLFPGWQPWIQKNTSLHKMLGICSFHFQCSCPFFLPPSFLWYHPFSCLFSPYPTTFHVLFFINSLSISPYWINY